MVSTTGGNATGTADEAVTARYRVTAKVCTDQVKHRPGKGEAQLVAQVGGVDDDIGWAIFRHVGEGCTIEHDAVVVIDRHLGAVEAVESAANPVHRVEQLRDQRLLHSLAQEVFLIVLEQPVAIQAIVGGGKTASETEEMVSTSSSRRTVSPLLWMRVSRNSCMTP